MIKSIHLGNFKAFAETQNIPIKPITLIFGPNSAGKSSIIHSLALIHQAENDSNLDVYRTEIGGNSIDLGGFRQYIYRRQANRRLEFSLTYDSALFESRLAELFSPVSDVKVTTMMGMPLDDEDKPLPGSTPSILNYELEADNRLILRASYRKDGYLAIDQLDQDHPVIKLIIRATLEAMTTTEKISDEDLSKLSEAIDETLPALKFLFSGVTVVGPEIREGEEFRSHQLRNYVAHQGIIPIPSGSRIGELESVIQMYLPRLLNEIVGGLNQCLFGFLNRLQYLGPLRSYPPRHLAFSEHEDGNWRAGGAYAWDIVRQDKEVRTKVNTWLMDKNKLKTPYELAVQRLISPSSPDAYAAIWDGLFEGSEIQQGERDLSEGEPKGDMAKLTFPGEHEEWDGEGTVENVIRNLLEETKVHGINELVLIDKRSNTIVSHKDVGIGISQVLPVLVGAFGSENKVIAIEQPEIHLHPKLQADLGDVFIESALGESQNTFLLETHSEHLILRILRRIRETTEGNLPENMPGIKPEDVSIIYVEPTKNGAEIHHLGITPDGDFADPWPDGFFAERAKELF